MAANPTPTPQTISIDHRQTAVVATRQAIDAISALPVRERALFAVVLLRGITEAASPGPDRFTLLTALQSFTQREIQVNLDVSSQAARVIRRFWPECRNCKSGDCRTCDVNERTIMTRRRNYHE